MSNDLQKLLQHVFDLEGQLLLMEQRGTATPRPVLDMIKYKARQIHEEAQALMLPKAHKDPSAYVPASVPPAPTPIAPPKPSDDDFDEQTMIAFGNGPAAPVNNMVLPQRPSETAPVAPPPMPKPAPVAPPPAPKTEPVPITPPPAPKPTPAPTPIMPPEAALRVDEKLGRQRNKDLRSALSVNDRFRFRRELFEDSDAEMNNAFTMIDSMKSMEEAEDYFYDFVGLDKENPAVQEFMEILRLHFS